MEQSILISTKKVLGIHPDDESFDLDVLTHINASFAILQQLGAIPPTVIESDDEEWSLLGDDPLMISEIRTAVYLRVRLLFDPPTTSYLLAAMEEQVREHEWRINVRREETEWVDPDPPLIEEEV